MATRKSAEQDMLTRISKLAADHPELRVHLVPILKKQAASKKFIPEMLPVAKKLVGFMKKKGWVLDGSLRNVSLNDHFEFSQTGRGLDPWGSEDEFNEVGAYRRKQLLDKYNVGDYAGMAKALSREESEWRKEVEKTKGEIEKIIPKNSEVKVHFGKDRYGTPYAHIYVEARYFLEWTNHRASHDKQAGISDVLFRMYKRAFTNAVQVLYKQFYRSRGWGGVEGVAMNVQPGLWEVTSKYGGSLVSVSYHVDAQKITITCGLQNLRHRLEEQKQVTPLEFFFSRDMDEKNIQEYIEKFIINCAKRIWR